MVHMNITVVWCMWGINCSVSTNSLYISLYIYNTCKCKEWYTELVSATAKFSWWNSVYGQILCILLYALKLGLLAFMVIIMATFIWNTWTNATVSLFDGVNLFCWTVSYDHVCVSVYVCFMIICLWDGCLSSERRQYEQFKKHNLKSFPLSFWGPGRFGCQATLGKSFQLSHFELDGPLCCPGLNYLD